MYVLLAVTELGLWVGGPSLVLCLVMIGYVFLAPFHGLPGEPASRAWTIAVGTIVYLAVSLWLIPAIYLLALLAWYDDMPRWFQRSHPWIGTLLGLATAAWIAMRAWRGSASQRYLRVLLVVGSVLLVLWCVAFPQDLLALVEEVFLAIYHVLP